MNKKTIFGGLSLGVFVTVFFSSSLVQAAPPNFSVSPIIIDYTTEQRDIINRDLTLTNNSDRPVRIYASVHEISVEEGTELREFVSPAMTNRATTITSWIEITRARLELPALGTLVVPLTIRVHPETPPGTYHALIGFASGPNRDDIEAKVLSGQAASVIVKITISDERREQLHVLNFTADRFMLTRDKNDISFTVENTGDIPLSPSGEVVIYDTTGKELAAFPVNSSGLTVAPGERVEIREPLPFTNRIGRNKAHLNLEYGGQQAAVFDTAFYYSLPWYYLAAAFGVLTLLLSLLAFAFRRSFADGSYEQEGLVEVPMFVRTNHSHVEYEHDINLKNNGTSS